MEPLMNGTGIAWRARSSCSSFRFVFDSGHGLLSRTTANRKVHPSGLAGSCICRSMSEGHRNSQLPSATVRLLLASRGLTVAEASRLSRLAFPADKRFHVPPNLCHLLEQKQFALSLQQFFALSRFPATGLPIGLP